MRNRRKRFGRAAILFSLVLLTGCGRDVPTDQDSLIHWNAALSEESPQFTDESDPAAEGPFASSEDAGMENSGSEEVPVQNVTEETIPEERGEYDNEALMMWSEGYQKASYLNGANMTSPLLLRETSIWMRSGALPSIWTDRRTVSMTVFPRN